jgi:hypothetical protein
VSKIDGINSRDFGLLMAATSADRTTAETARENYRLISK